MAQSSLFRIHCTLLVILSSEAEPFGSEAKCAPPTNTIAGLEFASATIIEFIEPEIRSPRLKIPVTVSPVRHEIFMVMFCGVSLVSTVP
jgi:hypothetical protein